MHNKHSPSETVSVSGSFFSYGFGLFETMKPLDGGIAFFDRHWQRLTHSATQLGFHIPEDQKTVGERLKACLQEEPPAPGSALKLCLIKDAGNCRFVTHLRPPLASSNASPAPCITISKVRRNETSPLCRHKTMNYMENILLLQQARTNGFLDVLFLNCGKHIAETTTANIFWIRQGKLYTPSIDCGALPGIIRQVVLELATEQDIPFEEGHYPWTELASADAIFLTNSIQGIRPVFFCTDRPSTDMMPPPHPIISSLQKGLHKKESVSIYR